jgi:hypothetical protein
MGARDKLNWACVNGALLIAGCAGLVTSSWGMFWIVLIVIIVIGCCCGDIRPTPGGPGRGGRHRSRGHDFGRHC